MLLFIDNLDSFSYLLVDYFKQLDTEVVLHHSTNTTIEALESYQPQSIVIGPGPGHPTDYPFFTDLFDRWLGKIPILGICLGHQALASYFGAKVVKAQNPFHGKASLIHHNAQNIFTDIPSPFSIARYHSLVVDSLSLPGDLSIDATTDSGEIMALSIPSKKAYGFQFHPESVMTKKGLQLLHNFLNI